MKNIHLFICTIKPNTLHNIRMFMSHFTWMRRTILLRLFVARVDYRYCFRCCATSCKSRPLKPEKPRIGSFFFFCHWRQAVVGPQEAAGKSLIHLGRSESGVNLCENNVEGWIMMIVKTTCKGAFMFLRMAGWFPGCIAHPSETHNRGSFLPVLPQLCSDRQISPLSPLLELGLRGFCTAVVLVELISPAKLPRSSVTDRLIIAMKALCYA